jgi:hypothetical protein
MNLVITEEQFQNIFKPAAEAALEAWGLTDWEVHIFHEQLAIDRVAECEYDYDAHWAKIRCNKAIPQAYYDEATEEYLRETAEHEVVHLVLSDIGELIRTEDLPLQARKDLFEYRAHALCNRLGHYLRHVRR